jgi:hypothetical protein
MLRRVELASWRGHLGSRCILEAWRLTLLFLMWCILRERNAKNFKNCEKSVVELRVIMFKSLSTWMAMYIITSLVCLKFLDRVLSLSLSLSLFSSFFSSLFN